MLSDQEAAELTEKAKSGDRSAFDRLFLDVRERLVNFARSRMSDDLRQRVDPEDVLQETFLRAYRTIEQFSWQGEASFCRWLEGIAGHVILDDSALQQVGTADLRVEEVPRGRPSEDQRIQPCHHEQCQDPGPGEHAPPADPPRGGPKLQESRASGI